LVEIAEAVSIELTRGGRTTPVLGDNPVGSPEPS